MSNHEQNLMMGASAAGAGQTTTLKRTLSVHISGSLSNLSLAGPMAGMWKPASGKESEIFKPELGAEASLADATNSLRNGVIRKVELGGFSSTFPFTLGVTMSCVRPMEVTDLGERFAYTVLPRTASTSPQEVYTCDPGMQQDAVWRTSYSRWNKSNLETEGVMDTAHHPYVFAELGHPVVGILKFNAPMIGCDIEKQPKFDGQYYKITRQVMAACCHTLRTQVLGAINTEDLTAFTMQIHRPNAPTWDHLDAAVCMQGFAPKAKWSAEELARETEHHVRTFMTTEYHYHARVQITYELPNAPLA